MKLDKYKDRQLGFCFNKDCAKQRNDYLYCYICSEVIKAAKKSETVNKQYQQKKYKVYPVKEPIKINYDCDED